MKVSIFTACMMQLLIVGFLSVNSQARAQNNRDIQDAIQSEDLLRDLQTTQLSPDHARDSDEFDHEHAHDDGLNLNEIIFPYGCTKASSTQIGVVKTGNAKIDKFVSGCVSATGSSRWCQELTRPNPSSRSTFICTYGSDLPHQLIHPDESTWKSAYKAVQLVTELEQKGISVYQIYNWWRPEPYNENVGGAAGRHPFGTSVDVRFSSTRDMEKAHSQLCKWRTAGRLRAIGYYGSTGLHFGIGDARGNTWGKGCP